MSEKSSENKKTVEGKTENLFSKEQLLSAERFRGRRDLLNAILSSDKKYTIETAEQEINKYMKGKVN